MTNVAPTLPAIIASRYLPIRLLAKGGMGVVYEVEHARTGEHLALKVLLSSVGSSAKEIERFKREARASARIKSEHVVRVTDADVAPELGGAPFLVMELLEGADLEREAGFAPLKPATVVDWLRQVARALDKAHRLGIVHRDLKPENLFLAKIEDRGPIVKILDFGIVKMLEDGAGTTSSGQILGTPKYMAPEQASMQKVVTVAADRYALGLIAYRLLAGESYYRGDVLNILAQLLYQPLEPPSRRHPALGGAFDTWFLKACHRSPQERFASAFEQIEALAAAFKLPATAIDFDGQQTVAPRISPTTRFPSRRSHTLVAGVAAALVLMAAGVLWLQRPTKDGRNSRQPVVASVDRPLPKSSNPEAVRVYLEGLQADRDGRRKAARQAYDRALELDPGLAPALLRVSLLRLSTGAGPSDDIREYFRRALISRASLDERDQAWLDAWEPVMQRVPADQTETIRRLRAALQRFSNDVQIARDLVGLICDSPDIAPEARIAEAKAAGLGPDRLAEVIDCANVDLGKKEEGFDGQDPCERTPADLRCLRRRANVLADQGRCAESEAVARRMLTLDPDGTAVMNLATALLGQPGQEESVREFLRKWTAGDRMNKRMLWGEIAIATATGDFTTAIERIHSLDDLVKDIREEKDHAEVALMLATALEEIGRPREADRVARAFLARRAAYEPDPDRNVWATTQDPTGNLLGIERRAGGLSAEQYREQLQARFDWWDRRLGKTSWLRYFVWQTQYASSVETVVEAREALAARPQVGRSYNESPRSLGRTFLLAGMVDEALPRLERDAKSCEFVFGDQLQHTRSWFFLGEARAAKGDQRGACAAYGKLLERWGAAKPRSVTAEKARRRRRELGC